MPIELMRKQTGQSRLDLSLRVIVRDYASSFQFTRYHFALRVNLTSAMIVQFVYAQT